MATTYCKCEVPYADNPGGRVRHQMLLNHKPVPAPAPAPLPDEDDEGGEEE